MHFEMSQRNWNRNVIFLAVITQIERIAAVTDIIPANHFEAPKCEQGTVDGYLTVKCGKYIENKDKDLDHYLPSNLQENIQVLDLIPNNTTEYVRFDFYPDDFHRYTKLKRILIRRLRSSSFRTPQNIYTAYSTCFKDIKSLHHLEFTHSNLSEEYTFGWPKNLRVLNLDNNKFQKLEIKECKELQELSANENFLQDVPIFHYRSTPVKILRLKGNPLDNMTILSLAPLCELSILELEFPPEAHYAQKNSIVSYCDCVMLKKWSDEAGISGPEKLTCHEPKKKIDSCSQAIFEKAKKLHKGCPILKSHRSYPILKILEHVLFVVIFLMFIAAIALFVVRHFHLKEKLTGRQEPEASSSGADEPSKSSETESDYE